MEVSEIDLAPLRRAVSRLAEGLEVLAHEPGNTLVRDGVIQRFEFTYELSHRMLRRFLDAVSATPGETSALVLQDLIRIAGERGLLHSTWKQWRSYREARAKTSHTYAEATALEVLRVVPEFLEQARDLLESLESSRGRA